MTPFNLIFLLFALKYASGNVGYASNAQSAYDSSSYDSSSYDDSRSHLCSGPNDPGCYRPTRPIDHHQGHGSEPGSHSKPSHQAGSLKKDHNGLSQEDISALQAASRSGSPSSLMNSMYSNAYNPYGSQNAYSMDPSPYYSLSRSGDSDQGSASGHGHQGSSSRPGHHGGTVGHGNQEGASGQGHHRGSNAYRSSHQQGPGGSGSSHSPEGQQVHHISVSVPSGHDGHSSDSAKETSRSGSPNYRSPLLNSMYNPGAYSYNPYGSQNALYSPNLSPYYSLSRTGDDSHESAGGHGHKRGSKGLGQEGGTSEHGHHGGASAYRTSHQQSPGHGSGPGSTQGNKGQQVHHGPVIAPSSHHEVSRHNSGQGVHGSGSADETSRSGSPFYPSSLMNSMYYPNTYNRYGSQNAYPLNLSPYYSMSRSGDSHQGGTSEHGHQGDTSGHGHRGGSGGHDHQGGDSGHAHHGGTSAYRTSHQQSSGGIGGHGSRPGSSLGHEGNQVHHGSAQVPSSHHDARGHGGHASSLNEETRRSGSPFYRSSLMNSMYYPSMYSYNPYSSQSAFYSPNLSPYFSLSRSGDNSHESTSGHGHQEDASGHGHQGGTSGHGRLEGTSGHGHQGGASAYRTSHQKSSGHGSGPGSSHEGHQDHHGSSSGPSGHISDDGHPKSYRGSRPSQTGYTGYRASRQQNTGSGGHVSGHDSHDSHQDHHGSGSVPSGHHTV